jgi:hypothetical protein
MADPYGNYLANLSPFAGPGLAPMGMTPEQAALYGMPKPPEAMDPGLSYLGGGIAAELGPKMALEGLQNMADLGHGIDPKYNSAGLDVGPKAVQAMGSLGAGAMRGMIFAEPGAAGVFGGRAMRSWDPKLAKTADKMDAAGLPEDAIYDATKLFKTADGQWKREIPDLAGSMKPQALEQMQQLFDKGKTGRLYGPLMDFIRHPMLFDEYPQLMRLKTGMRFLPNNTYEGLFQYTAPGALGDAGSKILSDAGLNMPERGPNSLFGVTMHEVNHALANREGFAAGSNPTAEKKRLKSMYGSLMDQINAELTSPSPDQAKINKLRSALREVDFADPYDLYQRAAGEVDSRAVQQRLNMTAPELNAVSPRQTVQSLVPFDRQIIRKWSFN